MATKKPTTQLFQSWIQNSADLYKSASVKRAADEEAISGIKDPACQGTTPIPSHPDGNNRSLLGLPTNKTNMNEPNKEHNIYDVTQPNGVGQGSYTTPRSGNAREDAANSPTVSLDKVASNLDAAINNLRQAGGQQTSQFQMPSNIQSEVGLMDKLASIGAVMVSTTEGQNAVAESLARAVGVKEASAIFEDVTSHMAKEAAAMQQQQYYTPEQEQYLAMQKVASDQAAHTAWLNSYNTDIEKQAYAQGAADAEQMDGALQAGADPSIEGASEDPTDEDIMAAIQELVESGALDQQAAEALLQQLGSDGQVGGSLEQIAAELQQAVQAGDLSPEDAEVVAQAFLADFQGGGEAPAEDPAMAEAQEGVNKTASVINYLYNN